jgi:ABC-type multidrug transport system ATPase subunit
MSQLLDAAPCEPIVATLDGARNTTGVRIDVRGVGQIAGRRGTRVLSDVSLSIRPGELLAIVGGSGAGKTTLLDAIAGVRPPAEGSVRYDGLEVGTHREELRGAVGYVPQDDIIHRDLPLEVTLRYAARLRLPAGTPGARIDDAVRDVLRMLDLEARAGVKVGALSGGQRKRASIGVELLTRPRAFFLDEPTSGLDPATARSLVRTLRCLAEQGTTVVLTTHNTDDLAQCDRIAFMASGRLVFVGSPTEALRHFAVDDLAAVYERLADSVVPPARAAVLPSPRPTVDAASMPAPSPGAWHQWRVLTARNLDVLRRNRLTMAIMLGSPALVVAMFAVLFQPHAFSPSDPSATAAVAIPYWIAFAGFFFGLTYGLLQITTEQAILRRERFVFLRTGPYLLAKVTVLVPVLLGVTATMLTVLRATDRLPGLTPSAYFGLTITVMLDAVAALALGLLASAAVADPAQATLALPMICFPAVLFSGAVLPVPTMAAAGRLLSAVTSDRFAYEAVGRQLGVEKLLGADPTGRGPRLLDELGRTFTGGVAGHWALLALFAVVFLIGAYAVINRRTRPA